MQILQILKRFLQILKRILQILKVGRRLLGRCAAHPGCYGLSRALFEGKTEGAVTAVAALLGQLLGNDGLSGSGGLFVEAHEVVDAQVVDIGIVGDALTGEILAEIKTVDANRLSQLLQGQVALQVKS